MSELPPSHEPRQSPRGHRLLRTLLASGLVAATVLFLALAIARNWAEIAAFEWDLRPAELAASVALLVLALSAGVAVWHRIILRFESQRIPFGTLLRIWFLSNLARYVPGKVWQFVGAVQLGRRAGVAPAILLTSMVILTGITLVSAALLSLLALPTVFARSGWGGATLLAAGALLGLTLVHPAVLNFALRRVPDRFHAGELAWTGSWTDGIRLLAMSTGAWILYGLAFALFTDSLVGISLEMVVPLMAANALAFIIGFLFFVTPGGLGAREAALALLLGPLASLGVAAIIAVAFRLWLILAELLGAALVLGWNHRSRSSEALSR